MSEYEVFDVNRTSYESFSTLLDRPVLTVSIETGPDRGKSAYFDQARITLGRDPHSDIILGDQFVSHQHGAFLRSHEGFVYKDLNSMHGTLVRSEQQGDDQFHKSPPDDAIPIVDDCSLRVGTSELLIRVDRIYQSAHERGASRIKLTKEDSEKFLVSQKPADAVSRQFTDRHPRLDVLSNLAGTLNGMSQIDSCLELIVEAAFKAFPIANLFSISLQEGERLRPLTVRLRDLEKERDAEVILSRTILNRVIESGEAVIFVRGEMDAEPSRSILEADISSCMCAPLVGQNALLGVMQVDTRHSGQRFSRGDLDLFCVLASHVAFSLERANLTDEIYRMFEGFVEASVNAIEARDPTTAGHSERVAQYTLALAEAANEIEVGNLAHLHFSPAELTELRYAALLHDFGKVGVRECVLTKEARLGNPEMEVLADRFRLVKTLYRQRLTETLLRRAIKEGTRLRSDHLHSIDKRCRTLAEMLDRDLDFIERIRGQWEIGPEDIQRIKTIGARRFIDPEGHEISLLTDIEITNMVVPRGTLNAREWEDMRSHVSRSEDYLERIPWSNDLRQVPTIAGGHHEKLDGSGYPRGLKGDEITPPVRILTIADIFDAATAWDRPYSLPISIEDVSRLLDEKAGIGRLDKDLVALFIDLVIPKIAHLVPTGFPTEF